MSRARVSAGAAALAGLVLVLVLMALTEFGQAWYYPGGAHGVEVTRAFGGAFRLVLWIGAALAIVVQLPRAGGAFAAVLWPFLPFLAWGAAASLLWSVDPATSLRTLVFWLLGAGLAVSAGRVLPEALLARVVAGLFATVVLASLVLAAVHPEAAFTHYGDEVLVRGLFPHKNQLGWFCAVGFVWTATLRGQLGGPMLAVAAPVLVAGLVLADSTTASAIAAGALAVSGALALLPRLFRDGARAAMALTTGIVAIVVLAVATGPSLLAAVGRDATLAGRTAVWRHYLGYIEPHGFTGVGAGVFSTVSELNLAIGGSVPGLEAEGLHSPHNLYLGVLGETGLVGVLSLVLAHLFLALAAPFRVLSPWTRLAGTLSFAIVVAGLAEMRDGYSPGVATFVLLMARSVGLAPGPRGG